jgi:carboxypeptidase PM20D1
MRFFASLFKFLKLAFVVITILVAVLVYRTFDYTPTVNSIDKAATLPLDYAQAAQRLAGALRFKTISPQNPEHRNTQQFLDFHQYLQASFPLVHQQLELTKINQLSLLYRWKSKGDGESRGANKKPIVIMGHFDVVPVDPSTINDWAFPPFDGVIDKEIIWGRGALDDKSAVLAILESIEYLLSQNFQPDRDIYFSFGHDEEIGGIQGAAKAAEFLKEKGIQLEYVLDEGGFVTQGMMPGFELPLALIGVAEKGYVSVKLSVQSEGGHSSVPPQNTSIGIVSQAIVNLENSPFAPRLVTATEKMLTTVGKHMSFGKRLVFANLWLFKPFLIDQLTQSKLTNATIRTTMAATVFRAGDKENALPINASAIINLRLLPGDSIEQVTAHINQTINDVRVKVEVIRGGEATPISSTQSVFYKQLSQLIDQVSPEQNLVIVPNLMVGGTDSKLFVSLAENVYRFNGVKINPESFSGFHGTNEYLSVKEYQRAINFYYQVLKLNQ